MSKKKKKHYSTWWPPEEPKAHEELPDNLGIGVHEERDEEGQLVIYFEGNRLTTYSFRLVLGKYRSPQSDGSVFYVWHKAQKFWKTFHAYDTAKFDHLIMAISFIVELKAEFDKARAKGMKP